MEQKYLVGTGAVIFTQHARSPKQALNLLKQRLRAASAARSDFYDSNRISQSLLDAFLAGNLNFIVMDAERAALLCGEYKGCYEEPVSRALATSLRQLIPDSVWHRHNAMLASTPDLPKSA